MKFGWIACCAAVVIAGSARAEPPPLSAYADDPTISGVGVAPDGSKAVFLRSEGDNKTVVLVPAADQPPIAVSFGQAPVTGTGWLDPDHLLIIQTKLGDLGRVAPRQMLSQGISYNVRTGHGVTLLHDTSEAFPVLDQSPLGAGQMKGVPVAFLRALAWDGAEKSPRFSLYAVDLDTGRGHILDRGSFNADRWVVAPDASLVARTDYDPGMRFWSLWSWRAGAWSPLLRGHAESRPNLIGLGRTDGVVAAYQEGELFELSLTNGARTATLVGPETPFLWPISNPTTGRLLGVRLSADTPTYDFFDPALKTAWDKVAASFPGRRVALMSYSSDYSQIVVEVEGPGQAGSYYWVHLDRKSAEMIGDMRPLVPADQVGDVRKIDFTASDGLKIGGYLTLPPGRQAQQAPLVVLVRDGPWGRDELTFDPMAQAIASRGYAVLQVNFRGSTGVAKGFDAAGYGEWGRKMQTDLSDGVAHLVKLGVVDPKRVCIMGTGYGGYAALAGVTVQHGLYRCAVAVNAISDPADEMNAINPADSAERGPNWEIYREWKRYLGAETDVDPKMKAISPRELAAHADAPVLLMHGTEDTIVPPRQSEAMRDTLTAAKRPVEYIALKGADHSLRSRAARAQMLEGAIGFLKRNNPPG